ncbi:hypothetical protein JKP88DRAFT_263095 [Tribonema minus]|uniref:Uncharacterized protein n=1 Tax=Tribonema minus TaxID=303371 RepID=A0A835YW14_9STRA|nr:hypothetical protein JKP88DRAFT_263095 [Tribonema minus]
MAPSPLVSLVLLACLGLQCAHAFVATSAGVVRAAVRREQQVAGERRLPLTMHCRRHESRLRRRRSSELRALDPAYIDAVNELMSGFAGGTVGVMGTLIGLELKKQNVVKRSVCPYCQGAGTLTCARCYGVGILLARRRSDGAAAPLSVPCGCCGGAGGVTCNICRGDGASVPPLLEYKGAGGYEQLGRMPALNEEEYEEEGAVAQTTAS